MSGRHHRGAVIGCGYIAEFHLRGWARIPEVEIVALADPDRARAGQRRDEFAGLWQSLPLTFACPILLAR